ncbi:MAG: phosphoribosylformylglycinamidine synthase subunit PurL [Gammaproteobacteria bacterium]|nr:phosphoribosylformylglycinamidine synthase subunit PurL [Gammaproteobacteria bacterium]
MLSQPVQSFDFLSLSAQQAAALLQKHAVKLSAEEALILQRDILKREPTLAELVLWSIQGSEHCSYRSSRPYLKTLTTDGPDVILGAKEDAGIVAIAEDQTGLRYGLVVSHESHNHPSQLVPYEGAATGVGGNIRDVCCMGAEVIAVADGLRFGDIDRPLTRKIQRGVIAGIAGYGNPVGVPNLAGDVYYDPGYNENCLVTVVTLGIVREDHIIHSYAPRDAKDYVFILVGKPTDSSGFGGASFASNDLAAENAEANKGAVQEPNAFLERHLLKATYALFDKIRAKNLTERVGFKDLGAGGIACASVELADAGGYGAEIHLEKVPVSQKNLPSHVMLCSETQERFMWVVPRDFAPEVLEHYNHAFALPDISVGACAAIVGHLRHDGQYIVKHFDEEIVHARASDVTKGIQQNRPFVVPVRKHTEPNLPEPKNYQTILLKLLAHENIASRAPIYENYDKQVQGRTYFEAGVADAGVMQPFNDITYPEEIRATGVALSLDQCPRYNRIDPYWGAVNAIIESARNVTAVGATPIAITDCLCFGNPEKPEQMWEFTESIRGMKDACEALHLPIIAGNVSFYNESSEGAIPPSPMMSCVGKITDVKKCIGKSFQAVGSILVLINPRRDECGGSVYYALHDVLGAAVPKPDLVQIANELKAMHQAIEQGLILSAHDISEGGLAVALAEMSFVNQIGVNVIVPGELATSKKLFSETGGFVLEVAKSNLQKFKNIFMHHKVAFENIGETISEKTLQIQKVISLSIEEACRAFENGLR